MNKQHGSSYLPKDGYMDTSNLSRNRAETKTPKPIFNLKNIITLRFTVLPLATDYRHRKFFRLMSVEI